jgi:hypothetical protein
MKLRRLRRFDLSLYFLGFGLASSQVVFDLRTVT